MKREGRQHGMVRTYRILPAPWNPRPESGLRRRLDSPPTAGLFTKVPSKPTNHSKFTGKCGLARCQHCHISPARKSKDKTKGTHKMKSGDVAVRYRLLSVSGLSTAGILDQLSRDCEDYNEYDDDDEDEDGCGEADGDVGTEDFWSWTEQENDANENDDFVDVRYGSDQWMEDEGWCFVGEI